MECRWWWAVGLAEYGLGRQQRAHQAKPSTGRMVVWLLGCAPLTYARSFTLAISWCAVCRLCVVEVIFKMIRITHSLSAQNLRSFLSVRPSVCPLRKKDEVPGYTFCIFRSNGRDMNGSNEITRRKKTPNCFIWILYFPSFLFYLFVSSLLLSLPGNSVGEFMENHTMGLLPLE